MPYKVRDVTKQALCFRLFSSFFSVKSGSKRLLHENGLNY